MKRDKYIRSRCTEEEKNKVALRATMMGYESVSEFILEQSLNAPAIKKPTPESGQGQEKKKNTI